MITLVGSENAVRIQLYSATIAYCLVAIVAEELKTGRSTYEMYGPRSTIAQMGNIAYRSGKKLEWNEAAHEFTDKAVNKEYWMKEYHNGYKLPRV